MTYKEYEICFNPLPAPKYREISFLHLLARDDVGFNPLPAPKYREMGKVAWLFSSNEKVSIRSLHRSTGR